MEELRAHREASCGERRIPQTEIDGISPSSHATAGCQMQSHAEPCWAQVPLLTSQITRVGRRYMRPGRGLVPAFLMAWPHRQPTTVTKTWWSSSWTKPGTDAPMQFSEDDPS